MFLTVALNSFLLAVHSAAFAAASSNLLCSPDKLDSIDEIFESYSAFTSLSAAASFFAASSSILVI
jgi:hypothetical protein